MTFDQHVGMEGDDADGEFRIARLRILPHRCNPTSNGHGGPSPSARALRLRDRPK